MAIKGDGRGGSRKKLSPAMLEAEQRMHQALELRLAGATLSAIAGKLGYASESSAYNAIKAVMAKTVAAPSAELREIETRRYDKLLFAIWPAAMKGDLDAIDRVLKIAAQRARLLGLDAPVKLADADGAPLGVTVFDLMLAAAKMVQIEGAAQAAQVQEQARDDATMIEGAFTVMPTAGTERAEE